MCVMYVRVWAEDESYYTPGVYIYQLAAGHEYMYRSVSTGSSIGRTQNSAEANMSDSDSRNIPGSSSDSGDHVKPTTNDHVEVKDKETADGVAVGKTAQRKPAARTFVTLDVKPWGMLVGINISKCH
jgi:hypothetical protein